jgi:predicted PurR-regulated permease PerM
MLLLLFFMLAYGDVFLRKLVKVYPRFEDKRRVLDIANDIERQVSIYLFTVTVMNTATGAAIGTALYFIGLPNAVLWGVMAALLEYIPYLGPLMGMVVISIVGILTFDSVLYALLAPLAYLIIESIQGNLVATIVYGRRFALNPVIILVWLTFWTWLWGIPGTLLAVPMLTAFKIFCDRIEPLSTLGEFIGS